MKVIPDEGYSWWRLFQKRVVRTKFDIYVFICKDWSLMARCKAKLSDLFLWSFSCCSPKYHPYAYPSAPLFPLMSVAEILLDVKQ